MAADLVEQRMNVASLKRVDPYIKDILGTATQVALYTFSAVKNEWEKTDVEGALFVCSRNGEPFNNILIMNRLNTSNLVEPIVKHLDWQMQAPFLLYRNPNNCIFGIWFYNRDECVKITYLLENIMDSLNKEDSKKRPVPAGADIFSMLSKAQEDFKKAPSKPESSTPRAPDVTSQSVMDFFAKASTTKQAQIVPTRAASENEPLLHRLMSNPAHSVEHIEKQQRSVTPQEQPQSAVTVRAKTSLDDSTPVVRAKAAEDVPRRGLSILSTAQISTPAQPLSLDRTNQSLLENGLNFMRISSPIISSSPRTPYYPPVEDLEPRHSPLVTLLDTPQKPALMPPMMFTSSSSKDINELPLFSYPKSMVQLTEHSPDNPEPLTRKQMVQAFHYLLKNDAEFVTKLHEAYVKSFSDMVS